MSAITPPKIRDGYKHFTTQSIRYGDLDRHNHVNNTSICSYIEDSRVRLRESLFPDDAQDPELGWMVVSLQVEFHAQLRYPGEVDVGTATKHVGKSSYTLVHGVFNGPSCVATATTVTVVANRKTGKACQIPSSARAVLESLKID